MVRMTTERKPTAGAVKAAKLMAISPRVRQLALGLILREEFSGELAATIEQHTHAGELVEALATLVDAVAGDQHDEKELRKGLGLYAPSAIRQARELLAKIEKGE